jgi:hypothetical protein
MRRRGEVAGKVTKERSPGKKVAADLSLRIGGAFFVMEASERLTIPDGA